MQGERDSMKSNYTAHLNATAILAVLAVLCCLFFQGGISASDLYPPSTARSWGAMASYSQPLIASGPTLPPVASASIGELFIDVATAGSPTIYRKATSSWEALSSSGSGVSTYSELTNLGFAESGHTGFASASLLASDVASLAAHLASSTDPHGATMTITDTLAVGSGTADCSISRLKTGTIMIASYTCFPEESATPTGDISTGTVWMDSNLNKLRVYDGTNWQNLW